MNNAHTFYPGQTDLAVSERERFGRAVSRRAAREGMVLLENDGTLPLKRGAKLALFGIGARHTIKGGTGSGDVNSRDTLSVDAGLRAAGCKRLRALRRAYHRNLGSATKKPQGKYREQRHRSGMCRH